MEASTTILPGRNVHSDNANLRPCLSLSGESYSAHLVISFGRRGRIRVRASREDVRRLAQQLVRLADAHAVACGDRQVAP